MDKSLSLTVKRLSDGWGKDLLKIVTISCFFVGMALLLRDGALRDQCLHSPLLQEILSAGDTPGQACRHAVLFVGTFGLLIGVGLPRLWVSAIAGAAFGAMEGALLALAASVIGATIVYRIGRSLLADLLKKRFARHFSIWQTRFQQNAFWWVLYMRLFPLSNATLAGLVCGACRLPAKPYLAGSLLGFIPLTVVFAVFGSGGAEGNFYQIALGTLLLLLAVGGRKLLAAAFRPLQPLVPGKIQNW